jgi:hypothetical protein
MRRLCGDAFRTSIRQSVPHAETAIMRVIPAVELTGDRYSKLRQIDGAIRHLEAVRRRLVREPAPSLTPYPARTAQTSAWPWLAVGVAVAMVPILLLIAESCG